MSEHNIKFDDLEFIIEIPSLIKKMKKECKKMGIKYVDHATHISPNALTVYLESEDSIKFDINLN
jgi:hypothetical protein